MLPAEPACDPMLCRAEEEFHESNIGLALGLGSVGDPVPVPSLHARRATCAFQPPSSQAGDYQARFCHIHSLTSLALHQCTCIQLPDALSSSATQRCLTQATQAITSDVWNFTYTYVHYAFYASSSRQCSTITQQSSMCPDRRFTATEQSGILLLAALLALQKQP